MLSFLNPDGSYDDGLTRAFVRKLKQLLLALPPQPDRRPAALTYPAKDAVASDGRSVSARVAQLLASTPG
jgi:hypothetical protein